MTGSHTHRYQAEQRRLGTLTEYFAFDDVGPVLRNLRWMQAKELTALELTVLADEPSRIELKLAVDAETRALERKARARSAAIAAGMEQARQQGIHVGRPAGGEPVAVPPASAWWPCCAMIQGARFGRPRRWPGYRSIRCARWSQPWGIRLINADN